MRKSAAAAALDDPLRIRDMKVPPSVLDSVRRRHQATNFGDGHAGGSQTKLHLTLGRVTGGGGGVGSGGRGSVQLRRRRTAVTGDADVGRRLRSLSAEERRIIEKIQRGCAADSAGGAAGGEEASAYQDLCKNVRLTFTGNQAISCSKLAANQARTMRSLETAKRPPQPQPPQPGPRRPGLESLRRRASLRPGAIGGSGVAPRGRSRGGCIGGIGNGDFGSPRLSRRKSVGKQNQQLLQKRHYHNQQQHLQRQNQNQQQSVYGQDVSIVKEVNSSGTSDNGYGGGSGGGRGRGGDIGCSKAKSSSSANDCSAISPGCSPSTIRQLEQRLNALDLRGTNAQTADAVASLNSWVCTGASLLRHISAAREATAPPQLQLQKQLREQQVRQLRSELEARQRLEDGWDPAEINVGRLIRRRHLDALLNTGCAAGVGGGGSYSDETAGADGDVQYHRNVLEEDLLE